MTRRQQRPRSRRIYRTNPVRPNVSFGFRFICVSGMSTLGTHASYVQVLQERETWKVGCAMAVWRNAKLDLNLLICQQMLQIHIISLRTSIVYLRSSIFNLVVKLIFLSRINWSLLPYNEYFSSKLDNLINSSMANSKHS